MWNNGQQQAAWWPTYSYSQVPALPTQDATFDESQQWAIKAAMWAQQKKMQEQFQQQVQIYHEQLQQQVPKTDLPPLPPETSLLKPPPPPDVESEQPPLPPFDGEHAFHGVNEPVKPSENLGTHQPPPPIHKGSLVDNIEHFRVHDNRENHTDTHGIDGKQGFIDTREPRRDFKKGHWRPFGTGVGSDELHQEGSVFGRQDYDDRVVHQHHEFSHNQSNRSDHEMHHEPAVYRDREPYIDNYKHNHHDDYQFDNVEIRHHRLLPPGLDPNVMVPPPILDQPQNLDYYGSQSRVPVFAFPQGGELQPPEPFPPSTEEVMALSGMEMARKKGLPMWLREALEKHEKEKQKKIAKGRGVDDKGKSKLSSISGYQHGASSDDDSASGDNIDEKNIEVNKQDQLNRKELNSSPSTGRQPSDASSEESGNESEQEDEAEKFQEFGAASRPAEEHPRDPKMLRVKKMVTEILLSVTNAEIKSITFEVYNEAKRTVLNTANLLRSSGGLDALRNAMGSYASSSDEDEKKRQDETILDRRDSSVPLDVGAKSSIAGTSKDNGKSTKTKLKHRSETKRRKSSDSSDSSSNSDTESSDSSTSSQSDTANVSVSTESSKGHRNKKSKGYSKRRRDRSLSASTSDVSLKKKKAKKRQRSLSPHERKSKTSRSPLGKKHRRKDSPRHSKDEKRQGKHESTNDEKSDTKQNRRDKKHKEKTPEKKHKRKDDEKKSKVSSRRKHKRKSEESEESSDNERKGSSAKRKTSKQRNRSRSRSRTPRHRKSEHRR